jgi:hypothetical protein
LLFGRGDGVGSPSVTGELLTGADGVSYASGADMYEARGVTGFHRARWARDGRGWEGGW